MKKQKIRFEEIVAPSDRLQEEMSQIRGGKKAAGSTCDTGTVCDIGDTDSAALDAFC
jgi:hypothetical protein